MLNGQPDWNYESYMDGAGNQILGQQQNWAGIVQPLREEMANALELAGMRRPDSSTFSYLAGGGDDE